MFPSPLQSEIIREQCVGSWASRAADGPLRAESPPVGHCRSAAVEQTQQQGIPSRDGFGVTLAAVTSGLTLAICDRVASGLKVEVTHMARIGYARVSTGDQDLEGQLGRLRAEGCEIVRSEKISGASREGRAELSTVIDFLRPGDDLVVTRLDRLGRDTRDVLNIVHECQERGAFVTVLDPHVSTRGEMGHVILTVLGMVAQMERRFIKERQKEGIERARSEGVYKGGHKRIDHALVRQLKREGVSISAIAEKASCSRMQVYRILASRSG